MTHVRIVVERKEGRKKRERTVLFEALVPPGEVARWYPPYGYHGIILTGAKQ